MALSRIRWTKAQQKKLSTAVSKFNGKLTRERRSNPTLAYYLPERLDVRELRANITTTEDLNRLVKKVDRAFKPGSFTPITLETGVMTTKWELDELRLGVQRINRQRAKRLERLPEAPSTVGAMGTIERNYLKPKEFKPEGIKAQDWFKFIESVERQQRASYASEQEELYKSNYLKAIRQELGAFGAELEDLIMKIPANVVADGLLHSPFLNIDFVYSESEAINVAQRALAEWTDFIGVETS